MIVLKLLGVGEGMQGLSATALGIGYVAGAVVVGQWGHRYSALTIFGAGIMTVGCMLGVIGVAAALGLSGTYVIIMAAFVGRLVLGIGYGSMIVAYGYILQRNSPGEMIGRVTATSSSLITGIPLISPLLGTLLASWLGLGSAYAMLALIMLGVRAFVVLALSPKSSADSR